jgi:hypothetical protein
MGLGSGIQKKTATPAKRSLFRLPVIIKVCKFVVRYSFYALH